MYLFQNVSSYLIHINTSKDIYYEGTIKKKLSNCQYDFKSIDQMNVNISFPNARFQLENIKVI